MENVLSAFFPPEDRKERKNIYRYEVVFSKIIIVTLPKV